MEPCVVRNLESFSLIASICELFVLEGGVRRGSAPSPESAGKFISSGKNIKTH